MLVFIMPHLMSMEPAYVTLYIQETIDQFILEADVILFVKDAQGSRTQTA